MHLIKNNIWLVLCCAWLVGCGGDDLIKSTPAPAKTSKPAPAVTTTPPAASKPAVVPVPNAQSATNDTTNKSGGYYLDDGPDQTPPKGLENIPNATPKKEALSNRNNRPYKALGETYQPMKSYQPYKERGVASWYGKRFHGKKTANGEIYDMYSMTAAHTILPLPSYAKVTNPANGRFVIVRVNDRGPFKKSRIIDLSYAAAYKLGYISKGSTLVEVEAIDPNNLGNITSEKAEATAAPEMAKPQVSEPEIAQAPAVQAPVVQAPVVQPQIAEPKASPTMPSTDYFVQAGAFKNEANADQLIKKIQGLEIEQNAGLNKVYNNGLHRLRIGPYSSKAEADKAASSIRQKLNIPAISVNQ